MMVRYYNPAYNSLSNQIDRIFEDFMGFADAPAATTWTPSAELIDQGNAYQLNVYLPGVAADDTDVQVTKESVSITGARKSAEHPEGDRVLYSDVAYGSFRRFINLPEQVQNTKVEASFENGMLSLYLPKIEEEQNKVVKVALGQSSQAIESSDATA